MKSAFDPQPSTLNYCPWPCLEAQHSHSQVAAAWQRDLGRHFPVFRAAFLQRTTETAKSYPCPRECGCAHEIIRHASKDIVAVCRCERWNCDDLKLQPDDIACWELNWARLGRELCKCLLLDHKPGHLGLGNTRQIGSWSAAAVPVMLTIQPEAGRFRAALLELVSRLQSPFILLAPTSRHLTASCLELLTRAQAGFFDLESHVWLMPNGNLRPAKAPGELFTRFTPPPNRDDQTVLERAFAVAKALDNEVPLRQPTPVAVFSHYCLEGLNVSQIARKFHCSRGTVLNRLDLIRQRTGMEPDSLRRVSSHIEKIEDSITDSRASRIYRKGLIDDEEAAEED